MKKIFQNLRAVLFLLVSVLYASCGSSDSHESLADFSVADLVGTWKVSCEPSQFGQMTAYRVATLEITPTSGFVYNDTHYGDDKCTTKYYEETSKGDMALGDAVDATGKRVTLDAANASATPRHSTVVTALNKYQVCGFNDWQLNEAENILNTECVGWSETGGTDGINFLAGSTNEKQIQVFTLANSGEKKRYAGDDFIKE